MELRIPLSDLDYDLEEENAVLAVIRSRWLTLGAVTQEFETEFARYIGGKHALAISNCTHALHLACMALGIGPGDEVIVPALTFVATSNAVLYTGAEVKFADIIGPTELTISPQDIEKQITPRTRAVIVMHYAGYPCRMPEIMEIARQHNLFVIEDAAHAPGATLDGRGLGTWGDIGCFSFFSNKNLAVGEGGMLVTNRDDIAEKVRTMRSHGMTTMTWDRHRGHASSYDVVELGNNYRIDEIHSALGLAQLHKLDRNNARREALTRRYIESLTHLPSPEIMLPFMDSQGSPAFHIMPVILPAQADRQIFMNEMRQAGVQTSIHYPPIHTFSYYRERYPNISLPITEWVAEHEITLPLYPTMKDEDVDYVVSSLEKALEAALDRVPHSV